MSAVITFLTDFGLQDDFVGVCRGVIKRIAPDAQILDLSHGIRPQAVTEGALVLARAIPYLPVGVHLGVRPARGRGPGGRAASRGRSGPSPAASPSPPPPRAWPARAARSRPPPAPAATTSDPTTAFSRSPRCAAVSRRPAR